MASSQFVAEARVRSSNAGSAIGTPSSLVLPPRVLSLESRPRGLLAGAAPSAGDSAGRLAPRWTGEVTEARRLCASRVLSSCSFFHSRYSLKRKSVLAGSTVSNSSSICASVPKRQRAPPFCVTAGSSLGWKRRSICMRNASIVSPLKAIFS